MSTNKQNKHSSPKNKKLRKLGRFIIEESKIQSNTTEQARAKTTPAVLAYFKSRWGEVDGYLPVLHKFKKMHPDWRIIAVIGSEHMANTVDEQAFLYTELKDTVDTLIRLAPNKSKRNFLP
jgi:3-deoxy-D-manno-octulosonic-acid transferase